MIILTANIIKILHEKYCIQSSIMWYFFIEYYILKSGNIY